MVGIAVCRVILCYISDPFIRTQALTWIINLLMAHSSPSRRRQQQQKLTAGSTTDSSDVDNKVTGICTGSRSSGITCNDYNIQYGCIKVLSAAVRHTRSLPLSDAHVTITRAIFAIRRSGIRRAFIAPDPMIRTAIIDLIMVCDIHTLSVSVLTIEMCHTHFVFF
jgi:hypothetical protein